MDVGVNVSTISFAAVPNDDSVVITGTEVKNVKYGNDNEYIITVKAEDGTTKVITITVNRPKALDSIHVQDEELVISIGEVVTEPYTLNPEDTTYPDVTWESLNDQIATVDENGTITGLKAGYAVIKVKSDYDEFIYDTVTVNVISNLIK